MMSGGTTHGTNTSPHFGIKKQKRLMGQTGSGKDEKRIPEKKRKKINKRFYFQQSVVWTGIILFNVSHGVPKE